jgi:outer membrane biogenesis lipoprotein LolB
MKHLLAALMLALLAGCTSTADERAFFNQGWLWPERGADERMNRQ